jgi:hypothetical protein
VLESVEVQEEASLIIAIAINTILMYYDSSSSQPACIRLAPCGPGAEIYYKLGSVRYGLTRRC